MKKQTEHVLGPLLEPLQARLTLIAEKCEKSVLKRVAKVCNFLFSHDQQKDCVSISADVLSHGSDVSNNSFLSYTGTDAKGHYVNLEKAIYNGSIKSLLHLR